MTELVGREYVGQNATTAGEDLEDKLVLDGHMFEINHPDQHQEEVDELDKLYDENASYDQVPADLRKWEVPITSGDQ